MALYKIVLEEIASENLKEFAVQLSQAVALFGEALSFPVIIPMEDYSEKDRANTDKDFIHLILHEDRCYQITQKKNDWMIFVRNCKEDFIQTLIDVFGVSEEKNFLDDHLLIEKDPLNPKNNWTFKKLPTCIHSLFSEGEYKGRDKNQVFQGNSIGIDVNLKAKGLESTIIAGNVVGRIALDVESISYPVIFNKQGSIKIVSDNKTSISMQDHNLVISYSPDIHQLQNLLEIWEFHHVDEYLHDVINRKNFDGQYVEAVVNGQDKDEYYMEMISEQKLQCIPGNQKFALKNYKDEVIYFEEEVEFQWERDCFLQRFKGLISEIKNLAEEVKVTGEVLKIQGGVSEDIAVREDMVKIIKQYLEEESIEADIVLVNSFKQGYSWLVDNILPRIKNRSFQEIKIRFSEFSKDPGSPWTNESGAVPSYISVGDNNQGKWFEMPIRLLQEIYPVDDIFAGN